MIRRPGRWFAVFMLSILAGIVYGISHDLVTAHLCVEYFTIGHPRIFPTSDPLLLALGWGVIATWWMGALLGIPLACATVLSSRPPLPFSHLLQMIAWLLLAMAVCAALAGTVGYMLAVNGIAHLSPPLSERVPPERHAVFLADSFAHAAAYGIALIGGVKLCILVWRRRGRMLQSPSGTDSCP